MATRILEDTVNAPANRCRVNPPSDEVLKKIADYFHVIPDYFYEYRLQKLQKYIDENREFLDECLKQSKKFKKDT